MTCHLAGPRGATLLYSSGSSGEPPPQAKADEPKPSLVMTSGMHFLGRRLVIGHRAPPLAPHNIAMSDATVNNVIASACV